MVRGPSLDGWWLDTPAHALREVAIDVLRGEFRVFTAARTIVDARMIHQRRTEQEETREHDHGVVVAAQRALRAKDFTRVVELLLPHTERLTPAERTKLDYARDLVKGDGGLSNSR